MDSVPSLLQKHWIQKGLPAMDFTVNHVDLLAISLTIGQSAVSYSVTYKSCSISSSLIFNFCILWVFNEKSFLIFITDVFSRVFLVHQREIELSNITTYLRKLYSFLAQLIEIGIELFLEFRVITLKLGGVVMIC